MSLKKKANDTCCLERIIEAVRFQYSVDGKKWLWYENQKYVATGQIAKDTPTVVRDFDIDPPI